MSLLKKLSAALLAICCLMACLNSNQNDIKFLHELDASLVRSTKLIQEENSVIYAALDDKLHDPRNQQTAEYWEPLGLKIKNTADSFKNFISSLKKEVKLQSNLRLENFVEVFDEENRYASKNIFLNEKKSKKLNEAWEKFIRTTLGTNAELKQHFESQIMISNNPDSSEKELEKYFEYNTALGALSVLSSYENKCEIIENKLITYCYNKIEILRGCGFGQGPYFLVSQSGNYIRKGEALIITASIAEFNVEVRPTFTINGKKLSLEENGTAIYKIEANAKPGFYNVPVKVEYYDADGYRLTREKVVKYEIAEH